MEDCYAATPPFVNNDTELSTSPVLSKKRRRYDKSPVLKSKKVSRVESESPIIENVSSPHQTDTSSVFPRKKRLRPKSLFTSASLDLSTTNNEEPSCSHLRKNYSYTFPEITENVSDKDSSDRDDDYHITETDELTVSSNWSKSFIGFSQYSTPSLSSVFYTPVKQSQVNESGDQSVQQMALGSARKKKQYIANGFAQQLTRLISRQESDYRIWRHQQKDGYDLDRDNQALHVQICHLDSDTSHVFACCKRLSGSLDADSVVVLFSKDLWNRLKLNNKDGLCIHPPWQCINTQEGLLILGVNLIHVKSLGEKASEMDNSYCKHRTSSAGIIPHILQSWNCPCLLNGGTYQSRMCPLQK